MKMATTILLYSLLLAWPGRNLLAQEEAGPSPAEQLAQSEEKAVQKLAKSLLKYAKDATKKYKMHGLAVGMFRQVLEWDPDNEDAREALGYEQVDGDRWVRPKEKTFDVMAREDEFVDPDVHKALNSKIKKKAEKFCEDAAKAFTKLAEQAERLGLSKDADRLWRQVLLYDIDNEEIRTKLGFARIDSGLWVPVKVKEQLTYTEPVKPYSNPAFAARFEDGMSFELKGAATSHGTLLFPATAAADKIQYTADVGERSLLVFKELFLLGDDFVPGNKYHYVLPTEAHYKYIVGRSIADPDERKLVEGFIACRRCAAEQPVAVTYLRSGGDIDSTSYIYAHHMAEVCMQANFGELASWIWETISNLIEEITTNSTNLSCVSQRTDTERPTVRKEGTEKKRRKACTDMVMEGLDRPLERALAAVGANEIEGSGIMKTTGVFNMLYMLDPEAFCEFIHGSVGKKGEAQKEVFKDAFGRAIPEWDNWWRYLVLGTYLTK